MAEDLGSVREEKGLAITQIVFSGTCEIDGETREVTGFTHPSVWADQGCSVTWCIDHTFLGTFPVREQLPPMIERMLRTLPDPDELRERYQGELRRQRGAT